MSSNGAFDYEMDRQINAFNDSLRATLLTAPDPSGSADLVRRMAEAARVSAATAPTAPIAAKRAPLRRRSLVARVAVAVIAIPLLFAGLAFAGVELPGPADDAFEKVGIELPNQTENAASDSVPAGEAPTQGPQSAPGKKQSAPGKKGSQNAAEKHGHGKDKTNPAREGGRANGTQGKGRALGKRGLAPGQTKKQEGGSNGGGGGGGGGSNQGKSGDSGKESAPGQAKKESGSGPPENSGGNGGGGGKSK